MAKYYYSPTKQKMLSLLLAGVSLSLCRSPKGQWKILEDIPREWKKIDRQMLYRYLKEFKYERLISYKEHGDGSIELVLSEKGKKRALRYKLDEMSIKKPKQWDGKWRMVIFDIPEKRRKARDALRHYLKKLEFYELQKSVWVHPFECKDEVEFIAEIFESGKYIRYATIENITNEAELKLYFNL